MQERGGVTFPPALQELRDQDETFRDWLRRQYVRNTYLGIFISVTRGQEFSNQVIIRQSEIVQMLLIPEVRGR